MHHLIFSEVNLDIKVNYDIGVERRFEVCVFSYQMVKTLVQIIAHGVDSKVVDDYVKSTIDTLVKYGKWKEQIVSIEEFA